MTTINIPLNKLASLYSKYAKQVPFAASRALNSTAFLMRSDIIDKAKASLRFRRDPRPALGIAVTKKAKKTDLTAIVGSPRGWLEHQVQDGVAKPKTGITFQGRKYLLVPDESRRGANGKLKKAKGGVAFIIRAKSDNQLVLMVRSGKRNNVRPIGILVPEAKYANDLPWTEQSKETFLKDFGRIFVEQMEKAIATAR